jgi:hypothetical protein
MDSLIYCTSLVVLYYCITILCTGSIKAYMTPERIVVPLNSYMLSTGRLPLAVHTGTLELNPTTGTLHPNPKSQAHS